MNICVIINCFLPGTAYGGPIISTTERVKELARRGHNVTVLTSNVLDPRTKEYIQAGVENHPGGFRIIRFPSLILVRHFSGVLSISMVRWLRKHWQEFDVFHISYSRELIPVLAMQAIQSTPKKIFLQTHGMLDRSDGFRSWIDKLTSVRHLKRADGVFIFHDYEKRRISDISPKVNFKPLLNGIRLSDEIPSWSGNNNDPPVVLFLSRLHPRKHVLTFIEAANIVLSKDHNVHFRVVGPDGGDETRARESVNNFGIATSFTFVGAVPHQKALLEFANASLFVLTAENEPFSNAIVEALAVGTPTIMTDSSQLLELLSESDAIEPSASDPASFAKAIEKLLHDPTLCEIRSKNGRIFVKTQLSIEIIIDRLEDYYKQ